MKFLDKKAGKSRISHRLSGGGSGSTRTVEAGPKCAPSWNQIQSLKDCLCCHIYCVHPCTHLYRTVTAARAVPNRESLYPQRRFSPRAAACHRGRTRVPTDLYIPFFLALISASPFSSTFSSFSEIGLLLVLTMDFNSMSGLRFGGNVRSQKRWERDLGDAEGRNMKSDLKKKGKKNF